LLVRVGHGQQLLAVAVADLKEPHHLLVSKATALEVGQPLRALTEGLVPDLGQAFEQLVGERRRLGVAWRGRGEVDLADQALQLFDGLREGEPGVLLQKADVIAGLAAAEAVIEALLGIDRQRRSLLLVSGTEGFSGAAFLCHFDPVDLEHLDQGDLGLESVDFSAGVRA
jgi:hypothetical protein